MTDIANTYELEIEMKTKNTTVQLGDLFSIVLPKRTGKEYNYKTGCSFETFENKEGWR